MSEAFLAGMVVGVVVGMLGMFVVLLGLAWWEERVILRSIQGGIDNDDDD